MRTRVDLDVRADRAVRVDLDVAGARRRLELRPHSVRSDSFQVLVQGDDGALRQAVTPPSVTYRGVVSGVPGSEVAAGIHNGRLVAEISLGDGDRWHVDPIERPDKAAATDATEYAVVREADLPPGDWNCGSEDGAIHWPLGRIGSKRSLVSASTASATAGSTGLHVAEIAFDADVEFFQLNGSSVAQTVADIEMVMNSVSALYEQEADITYEITAIVVRTAEPDPYTSTNNMTLLDEFEAEWNLNMRRIQRDVAHLMTGKTMNNNVIGTAEIGQVCSGTCGGGAGYGFSQSRFSTNLGERTCLTAHELGHNWGACHCNDSACTGGGTDADCGIMCGQLNQCGPDGCTGFGDRSLTAILDGRDEAAEACVSVRPAPLSIPFCDTFSNGTLDPNDGTVVPDATRWTYNHKGSIVSSAAAPSPPHVLKLSTDTRCPSAAAPDEIRSNRLQLGGFPSATLSYATRLHAPRSTGDGDLVVEFRTDTQSWTELNRLAGDGAVVPGFSHWSHDLPAAALDDSFRMRFRLAGPSDATWHVDDVVVTPVSPDQPVLFVRADAPPGGFGATWADAFNDLQDALAAAECSLGLIEEIWVAAGTYRPDGGAGDRLATFAIPQGLRLYGGFGGTETDRDQRDWETNVTVLSGEIGSPSTISDNSYHVVTIGSGVSATLDGFSIVDGNANGVSGDDRGAGMLNAGGTPTVRNCMFRGNSAATGGAIHAFMAPVNLEDCTFVENFAVGGPGGAIRIDLAGVSELARCRFLGNSATTTGGAIDFSNAGINASDCLFSGNQANYGGAIHVGSGMATCMNCSFASNSATMAGGAIYNVGFAVVDSSILWNNADAAGAIESSQLGPIFDPEIAVNFDVNHSAIQGWTGTLGGVGNSGGDPLWSDRLGPDSTPGTLDDDLHLRPGSAAINAGDPGKVLVEGMVDLDRRPRIRCGRVDMGAFEALLGDANGDGTTGQDDLLGFPDCVSGPGFTPGSGCAIYDADADGDVDLSDGGLLLTCPFAADP